MTKSFLKLVIYLYISFFYVSDLIAAGTFYFGTSAGSSFTQFKKNGPSIITFDGGLIDEYPLLNYQVTKATFSLNAGYKFLSMSIKPNIALGLGIYAMPINQNKYCGQVIETAEGDPSTPLYNYTFRVSNGARLMAEMQVNWPIKQFNPFINAGIGASRFGMTAYQETPLSCDSCAIPPFQSNTNTNFSYQVGFGLGYTFLKQEQISFGYRYVNLGKGLFKERGPDYPWALNMRDLTSNEIYLAYTHYF